MYLYDQFCCEHRSAAGELTRLSLRYAKDFNFGYDVVDAMAALAPQQCALVWCNQKGEEKRFSFGEIGARSSQCAHALQARGVRKGDRVLVLLKRNYEYWFVAPALHKLGAVLIPATHMLTVEDLTYRMQTADVSTVICTPEGDVLAHALAAQKRCPGLKRVITFRQTIQGAVNLTPELEAASPQFPRLSTLAADPMLLYFTSGTTGHPKAVMHDHTYPLTHIITARDWQGVEDGGLHLSLAETGWGKASWGKIYGQWLCGCAVMVYDFDAFLPRTLLHILEHYHVTSFCAPPTVYRYLVQYGMQKTDLSCLRQITTAGEALNPEVFRQVKEQTGLALREGYGQTESALIAAHFVGHAEKPGSMGKRSPLYQVQVLREDGSAADTGEVGELVLVPPEDGVQPGVFMGYYGDETLYQSNWRGGVYHTGDTVWVDAEGYFWYVGRVDDVMKCSGFRVGPFEIENILMEHPAVLECAVTGEQNANRGQIIKASVTLKAGLQKSKKLQQELLAYANDRLAEYKWIQKLEFLDELPKTISGKIRRTALR